MSFFVTFKEFASDPIKAILFLAMIAIMYLYVDNKMVYKEQIDKQEQRIIKLEEKYDDLVDRYERLQQKFISTVNHVSGEDNQ